MSQSTLVIISRTNILVVVITIGATLGVVMASNGIEGSMSIIVWLLIWRFVLGIGIGTMNSHPSNQTQAKVFQHRSRLSAQCCNLL